MSQRVGGNVSEFHVAWRVVALFNGVDRVLWPLMGVLSHLKPWRGGRLLAVVSVCPACSVFQTYSAELAFEG